MSSQPTGAFGNVINHALITGGLREVLYAIRSGLISDPNIEYIEMPNLSSNEEVHNIVFYHELL